MKKTIFAEVQVFLLVRGGLRRKIIGKKAIRKFGKWQIHEKTYFPMNKKKSNHKNALEAHFCDLISGKTISDIFMGNLGYIHG